MEIEPSPQLLESLNAAAADGNRTSIHHDLCTVFTESPEFGCSCGVPSLLLELRDLLPAPAMVELPFPPPRRAWMSDTAAA